MCVCVFVAAKHGEHWNLKSEWEKRCKEIIRIDGDQMGSKIAVYAGKTKIDCAFVHREFLLAASYI